MKTYQLIVNVRKVGSIGIFYPMPFTVRAISPTDARNKFFDTDYYLQWEARGIVSVTEETISQ